MIQKLNNQTITIHEFSTGVVLNSTETGGGIVSLTQNWMNVSFADGQVSYSVERAIINQFFSATGTETSPTIIGRFIPGEMSWSIVAISNLTRTINKKETSQINEDAIILPSSEPLCPSHFLYHFGIWIPLILLLFVYLTSLFFYRCFSYLYLNRLLPSWFYDFYD